MKVLLLLITLVFVGCVNKTGISANYYDRCHTEYDMYGNYKTVCPDNFYEYKKNKTDKKDCLQCN